MANFAKPVFCAFTAGIVHMLFKYFHGAFNYYLGMFIICYWVAEVILAVAEKNKVKVQQALTPNFLWGVIYCFATWYFLLSCCSDDILLIIAILGISSFACFIIIFANGMTVQFVAIGVCALLLFKGCVLLIKLKYQFTYCFPVLAMTALALLSGASDRSDEL